MGLITRTIAALYNGVSQQPAILRSPDQSEEELNTWATLAAGLGKRPPTQYVAKIANTLADSALVHHINRDVSERYVVIVEAGGVKVFDAAGIQQTVNAPLGYSYLTGERFSAVTVADYTFIVNRSKACAMKSAGADTTAQNTALRWLSNDPEKRAATALGNWIRGQTGQYAANPSGGTYAGEVASIEKLPETAANGTIYKVSGASGSTGSFASFYVRRNGAVWDETVAPSMVNAIDELTMPHCLVREANGTFTFAPFSWAPRRVGDANTNPVPTFINRTINDVFFYQNRLSFLVDENVVFSCTGDFGNFWRTTVLDALDSDVVSVGVTTNNVSILNSAVAFNDGLILFSDQTQFSLTNGENGLTPSSVAIKPTTNFTVNQSCRPVTLATEVYFAGDQQGQTVVWEYSRMDGVDSTTAAEITAHVPALIPSGIRRIIAAGKSLFALTGGPQVFTYQSYWNGNEKIVSAWRPWTMAGDVLSGTAVEEQVYLVVRRADGVFLETMSLSPNDKPAGQPKQVHLDRRVNVTGTYNPVTDKTQFLLPYEPIQGSFQIVRGSGSTAPHSLVDPSGYEWVGGKIVDVPGNESGHPYTVGEGYAMRFVFSRQYPVTPQGQPLATGRLQLRTVTVNFSDTAFFRTEVQPYGTVLGPTVEEIAPAKLADFTGKIVGAGSLRLNTPIYHTGSYSFQIYGDAAQARIALSNDTHVASTFVSAEWEGFWSTRATG